MKIPACPKCQHYGNTVTDVKEAAAGTIWRRRKCWECGNVWTTYEHPPEKNIRTGTTHLNKIPGNS